MKGKPFIIKVVAVSIATVGYLLLGMFVLVTVALVSVAIYQAWPPDLSTVAAFFIAVVTFVVAIGIWAWAVKYLGWDE